MHYILTIFSNLPWFYLASLTVRACVPGSIAVSSPDLPGQQDDLKKVLTPNFTPHKNLEILTSSGWFWFELAKNAVKLLGLPHNLLQHLLHLVQAEQETWWLYAFVMFINQPKNGIRPLLSTPPRSYHQHHRDHDDHHHHHDHPHHLLCEPPLPWTVPSLTGWLILLTPDRLPPSVSILRHFHVLELSKTGSLLFLYDNVPLFFLLLPGNHFQLLIHPSHLRIHLLKVVWRGLHLDTVSYEENFNILCQEFKKISI